jgi:hypothetical protein
MKLSAGVCGRKLSPDTYLRFRDLPDFQPKRGTTFSPSMQVNR